MSNFYRTAFSMGEQYRRTSAPRPSLRDHLRPPSIFESEEAWRKSRHEDLPSLSGRELWRTETTSEIALAIGDPRHEPWHRGRITASRRERARRESL